MAYIIMPFLLTFGDLHYHSCVGKLFKCNLSYGCAVVRKTSTDMLEHVWCSSKFRVKDGNVQVAFAIQLKLAISLKRSNLEPRLLQSVYRNSSMAY